VQYSSVSREFGAANESLHLIRKMSREREPLVGAADRQSQRAQAVFIATPAIVRGSILSAQSGSALVHQKLKLRLSSLVLKTLPQS
jgi:hypothetical protein